MPFPCLLTSADSSGESTHFPLLPLSLCLLKVMLKKIFRNLAAIAEAAYKGLYCSMVGRKNAATLPKPGRAERVQTAKKIHSTSKAA